VTSRIIEKYPKYQHFLIEPGLGDIEINIVECKFKL
jgi:hypothetical protein